MISVAYGVGINDADYPVQPIVNGKKVYCPFYESWRGMIRRCYSEELLKKRPTYEGCKISYEWVKLSSFSRWMQDQDWLNKELDKDIIVPGNKLYSPETCAFVDSVVNGFILDKAANRGNLPIGVSFDSSSKKFRAECQNPFTKKRERLGRFKCPEKAHLAWKRRKHELACQLADTQDDQRVAAALRSRYA